MESVFDLSYLLNILCTAIGFFTFIKLVSKDVYLSNHRILPTIAGVITIFDFYNCIIPFVGRETAAFLFVLCDMCALVIMFMMFFYFLFIKNPKTTRLIVSISLVIMILLCGYEFIAFYNQEPKPIAVDIVAVLFIFVGSIIVEFATPSRNFFDSTDRIIGRYMLVAFIVALGGYIADDYVSLYKVRMIALAVDCCIFFWLALSNRIEDTSTILKSTLFDRMEYPIALVNADFYVIDANESSMDLFPRGGDIRFAFDDGTSKSKFVLGEKLVSDGVNDKEYLVGDKWFRLHYTPVEDKNAIKGYIFTASDITEQHREAATAKLQTVKKSQFLAHMSHELRSPLHAILGISDILGDKKDISEKNKNLIAHIKRASENLLELVNAILDYSKLEAGKFEFAERTYDINSIFEDLAYSTILNIQSKPIDFNLAIVSDYPRYMYGDSTRVREIFQNILSNAVKFTDKGSIHAEIDFKKEDDRQKIYFAITDTGQGMTPSQIDAIFKEYYSDAKDDQMEGTGLGLAIVKQLIAKMDGEITAESDGAKGSVFKGYFYQKFEEGEYLTERVFNRRTLMNQGHGLHGMVDNVDFVYPKATILVADDMRINLEIMRQFLYPWKCQVVTVPDGATAVHAMKDRKFDLVFLDQMMMPVSGPEACKQIREFTDTPVILVTANSEDNARALVKECGFSDYLAKPILAVRLKEIMEKFMPKDLAEPNSAETVLSAVSRNRQNANVYLKTLDAFVKEMQPLLLKLPSFRLNDKEMFKVKVHGIAGVSKQIGRDTFAEKARIMEMAAKSDTWSYVDEHMDEFLTALCDVVEDATKELSQMAPDEVVEEYKEVGKKVDLQDIIENLRVGFDDYDISKIEEYLDLLAKYPKDEELEDLYEKLRDAYEDLEYDDGIAILSKYNVV